MRLALDYLKTVLITLVAALFLKSFVVEAFRIPSSSMEETLLVGDFLLVNKLAYTVRTPRFLPFTNAVLPTLSAPIFKHVNRGDVIVFEFPGFPDQTEREEPVNYIKRCVGLPGDMVEIQNGRVYVNDIAMGLPKYGRKSEQNGTSHHRSRLFPWGAGFSEYNYGPLRIPQKGDRLELSAATLGLWRSLIAQEGHTQGLNEGGETTIDGKPAGEYVVERNYYFVLGDNRDNSLDSRYWGFVPENNLIGEALFVYWSWDPDVPISNMADKLKSMRWNRLGTMIR
jgi:signal peptidase I